MKLYKSQSNEVFAYEEDGTQDYLIPSDYVAITEEEAQAIIETKKQLFLDKRSYVEKRRAEYPPIGDQLDALYKAGVFPADMAKMIAEVKAKYPKTSSV
jgi:hypothetical protein